MSENSLVGNQEQFKQLVQLIDKLRDVGLNEHISMPWIAVLGSQSSGKSSLLESIVGLNFLPRGSGVVTRRPLELRLSKMDYKEDSPAYGKFVGEDKKYFDFKEIRTKIEQLTDEVCGKNKGIVDNPIILQVYDKNCVDLTLIDLPGITKIPVGNQPKDIERITKEMVTRYCKDERTIILCVIPANADMSTQEALQLAQQLDPQGIRTLGVITKIDIMDKGTDARKMLLNKEIPLKLGYVGVKGRTQEDINNNLTVIQALTEENLFFQTHQAYWQLPKDVLGTQSLSKRLTIVMNDHIKQVLPSIIKELNDKINSCQQNITDLGEPIPLDNKKKLEQIWQEVALFYDKFKSNIKGEFEENYLLGGSKENDHILASTQIALLYNNLYKEYMYGYQATKVYSDKEINKIISVHMGNTIPGFVSIDCFQALISPLMENLRKPAIELLESVYLVIKQTGMYYLNQVFTQKEILRDQLGELFLQVVNQSKENTNLLMNQFIDCQTNVIFTKDPQYIANAYSWPDQEQKQIQTNQPQTPQNPQPTTGNTFANKITQVFQKNEVQQQTKEAHQEKPQEKQKMNKSQRQSFLVQEIKKRADKYFEISICQLADFMPKLITNTLTNEVVVNQQGEDLSKNVLASPKQPTSRPYQRARTHCQTKRKPFQDSRDPQRVKENPLERLENPFGKSSSLKIMKSIKYKFIKIRLDFPSYFIFLSISLPFLSTFFLHKT